MLLAQWLKILTFNLEVVEARFETLLIIQNYPDPTYEIKYYEREGGGVTVEIVPENDGANGTPFTFMQIAALYFGWGNDG